MQTPRRFDLQVIATACMHDTMANTALNFTKFNRRTIAGGLLAASTASWRPLFAQTPSSSSTLRLSPPPLSEPKVIKVTDALIDSSPKDPSGRPELQLGGGDYILELPTSQPLTRKLQINGAARGNDLNDVARHIVIIRGAVHPQLNYIPSTMRLLDDSDYALYTQIGFTGATGGKFRIRVRETASEPYTAPLPWNASASDILAALRSVPGVDEDGVFTVTGPEGGGPWKIVPGNNSKLGRPILDITDLLGAPVAMPRINYWNPVLDSLWLKFWTGTVHLEGVNLGGANGGDGIQVLNPFGDARLQIANVRCASNFAVFHNDWQHLDGAQMYNGPSQLLMENVELMSTAFNGFIYQPTSTTSPRPVDNLYAPWLRNVWIRSIEDDRSGRSRDDSTALFIDDGTRSASQAAVPLSWDMEQVYLSRESLATGRQITDDPDIRYLNRSGFAGVEQTGMKFRAFPPAAARPKAGLGYVSPGYLQTTPIQLKLISAYS